MVVFKDLGCSVLYSLLYNLLNIIIIIIIYVCIVTHDLLFLGVGWGGSPGGARASLLARVPGSLLPGYHKQEL